jgi:predicted nucleotidyltransferase
MRTNETSQEPGLTEVLFSTYRRQILSLLLLHPEESFYVREIARLTGVPAGSLHRELKLLSGAGLLTRAPAGNQVRYQVDRSCPILEELSGIFRKTVGLADVLREALAPIVNEITLAFIFGSVAEGKEREASDVDIMIIGRASFASVVEALDGTQEQLRRDVNPVVMTRLQFQTKRQEKDRFVSRIIGEPKLRLIGDLDELGELAEDRKT